MFRNREPLRIDTGAVSSTQTPPMSPRIVVEDTAPDRLHNVEFDCNVSGDFVADLAQAMSKIKGRDNDLLSMLESLGQSTTDLSLKPLIRGGFGGSTGALSSSANDGDVAEMPILGGRGSRRNQADRQFERRDVYARNVSESSDGPEAPGTPTVPRMERSNSSPACLSPIKDLPESSPVTSPTSRVLGHSAGSAGLQGLAAAAQQTPIRRNNASKINGSPFGTPAQTPMSPRMSRTGTIGKHESLTSGAAKDSAKRDANGATRTSSLFSRVFSSSRKKKQAAKLEFGKKCIQNDVVRKGWLHRRGRPPMHMWRHRVCVLTSHTFFYFEREASIDAGEWEGFFPTNDIHTVEAVPYDSYKKEFCFKISTTFRDFVFRADSEKELTAWVDTFQTLISEGTAQQGTPKSRPKLYNVGKYRAGKTIGEGGYSKVKLGTDTSTNQQVAIKMLKKSEIDADMLVRVEREIKFLRLLNHPYIVKLFDVEETDCYIFLVMEYFQGDPLDDYIDKQPEARLAEPMAREIFGKIVSAVQYCHAHYIVHRDLKMENVLASAKGDVRLIDFGLSNSFRSGDAQMRTHCGTFEYAAPEMVSKAKYQGAQCDVWSLGVILFAMVTGRFPFSNESTGPKEIMDNIMKGASGVYFPPIISPSLVDLLKAMLVVAPEERLTLEQVNAHVWMKGFSFIHRSSPVTSAPPSTSVASTLASSVSAASSTAASTTSTSSSGTSVNSARLSNPLPKKNTSLSSDSSAAASTTTNSSSHKRTPSRGTIGTVMRTEASPDTWNPGEVDPFSTPTQVQQQSALSRQTAVVDSSLEAEANVTPIRTLPNRSSSEGAANAGADMGSSSQASSASVRGPGARTQSLGIPDDYSPMSALKSGGGVVGDLGEEIFAEVRKRAVSEGRSDA